MPRSPRRPGQPSTSRIHTAPGSGRSTRTRTASCASTCLKAQTYPCSARKSWMPSPSSSIPGLGSDWGSNRRWRSLWTSSNGHRTRLRAFTNRVLHLELETTHYQHLNRPTGQKLSSANYPARGGRPKIIPAPIAQEEMRNKIWRTRLSEY